MSNKASERRLAENEVVFRTFNEQVQKRIDEVNKIAAEEGEAGVELDGSRPLYFYCECSDINCNERVRISPDDYNRIHEARDIFTVVCGHERTDIEDVLVKEPDYCVVKKHKLPPTPEEMVKPG